MKPPVQEQRQVAALIHDLVWERAAEAPDAVALVYRDEQMSYGEMVAAAGRVARRLQARGVGPEVVVGVCAERSPAVIVALLGILKAGGAYLPLDPDLPKERIAFMLNDARSALVLASDATAECLPAEVQRLPLDGGDDPLAAPDTPPSVHPANLAYVIYTSGSTGKPKGVMISHANVDALFSATQRLFKLTAADVWTLFHSLSFDFSVWELWRPLTLGGEVVIVPKDVARSPERLAALLEEQKVTMLNQTPPAFATLAPVVVARPAAAKHLRYIVFGGAALSFRLLGQWIDAFGYDSPSLINMYGLTECTVHATYHRISAADADSPDVSIIGSGLNSAHIVVLTEDMRPVAPGHLGQIYVSGPALARGYLARPALTADRFIPGHMTDDRLYRTGDMAKIVDNGQIAYLGRSDDQVKIRGYRIELGEVESAILSMQGIAAAAVLMHETPEGDARLCAYAVPNEPSITEGAIRAALGQKLPAYMLPAEIMIVDEIPLTVNGKVDRSTLQRMTNTIAAELSEFLERQRAS